MTTALSLVVALVSTPGMTAVKKVAAKKVTVKKAVPKRIVLGTKQLNGDQAQLGVTYTLGKIDPINVTLDKVEYTVEPVMIGKSIVTPKVGEKLLVLHYTLHNCQPATHTLGWGTLGITAVDANDTNWNYFGDVAIETTSELCRMALKPAQKTKVYTVIVVPAKGEIPKLMLQSSDKLVLRYDIRGKATKLPVSIADPADSTGATALESVPAQMGVYYPLRELHGKIDSVEFSTELFKDKAPRKGFRYLVIKGTAKNNLVDKHGFSWGTIKPKLVDADGGEIQWAGDTYYGSRDEGIRGNIEPGNELHFRWVFDVPQKVQPQSLSVFESNGRAYVYDLSSVK